MRMVYASPLGEWAGQGMLQHFIFDTFCVRDFRDHELRLGKYAVRLTWREDPNLTFCFSLGLLCRSLCPRLPRFYPQLTDSTAAYRWALASLCPLSPMTGAALVPVQPLRPVPCNPSPSCYGHHCPTLVGSKAPSLLHCPFTLQCHLSATH